MSDLGRRTSVLGVLFVLLGMIMFASGTGLLDVGYASPTVSPSPHLTDYVFTTFVLLDAVGGGFILYVVYIILSGPKKAPRDDMNLLLSAMFLVVAAAGIAVIIKLLAHGFGQHGLKGNTNLNSPPLGKPHARPAQISRDLGHTPAFRWEEFAVVGGLVAAIALPLVVTYVVRRRRGSLRLTGLRRRQTANLRAALDRGLDDLRAEPDLRRAIIAAYARMERALGSYRRPRETWETPLEYLAGVLLSLEASRTSVERLTHLFEWAKFSNHRPEPPMRDEAIAALEAVRAELLPVGR
jgi:Domain of unknown function (DUF4129)